MIKENRAEKINSFARKDSRTKDTKYNEGLRTILNFGYESTSTVDSVKYYCLCNNL